MLKAIVAGFSVGIILGLSPVSVSSAAAQTTEVPAADMAVFRACLARAETKALRQTCDQPIFDACNQRSSMPDTTITISECLMTQYSAWDKALNEIWPAALNSQEPAARTKLRNAQRIWINLRKADCDAVYQANIGGTIRGPASATCMLQSTKDRYFWVKNFPIY